MMSMTFPTGKQRARQMEDPPFAMVPSHFHSPLKEDGCDSGVNLFQSTGFEDKEPEPT